jgi:hypothetical protein
MCKAILLKPTKRAQKIISAETVGRGWVQAQYKAKAAAAVVWPEGNENQ